MEIDINKLLEKSKEAAMAASEEILKIYESGDFTIEAKSDNSPLTLADRASHVEIVKILEPFGLPILSEEGREIDYNERKGWEYFWMIDPLDGTKEFIKRNGEFTVNIALIHDGQPILGVVQVPVQNKLYYAIKGRGGFMQDSSGTSNLCSNKFKMGDSSLKIVASRSHLNEATQEFLTKFKDPEIVSMGSSLKLLAIAEGKADLYPRFAPTMEWDTAAAQIILTESKGVVLQKGTQREVEYNKQNLLNPEFLAVGQMEDSHTV